MLPREVAVALSYNGSTQAVMMATPADLQDFAHGFTLTEGIADPAEIDSVEAVETALGIDLQIWLAGDAGARLAARRRSMAGPVGCGLCGLDSLEQAMRPVRAVAGRGPAADQRRGDGGGGGAARPPAVARCRPRGACGGAVDAGAGMVLAREDVGRHNALDKLAGAMLRQGVAPAGAVVLTSRVSVDLVQKVARLGVAVLVAVSAPTVAALDLAEAAGLTVCAMARPDRFELFTHAHRIDILDPAHVA